MPEHGERRPLVQRDELEAAIGARQELGQGLEPQVVDAFVDRLERRIEERLGDRLRPRGKPEHGFVLALVTLGAAIPLVGIAASHGILAIIVICAALVLLNAVYRRS